MVKNKNDMSHIVIFSDGTMLNLKDIASSSGNSDGSSWVKLRNGGGEIYLSPPNYRVLKEVIKEQGGHVYW